jgi:2-succinyl-5-enolpyruvyl-6-hydroxy-3-cyclohexene-1-carboxylate synthase
MSFLPRTVELHTRRAHYADDENLRLRSGATPKWQSLSKNPAALAVNAEARAAALEHYTVALPLFAPPSNAQSERPGDLLQISDRVLYLDLEQDTVVMLGDLHYTRLTRLLDWFRKMDNKPTTAARQQQRRRDADNNNNNTTSSSSSTRGKGLRRLAMSVALWAHEVGAATLKAFARTVFADIEEFVLFMYSEQLPPSTWGGGLCLLEEAAADADHYRRFLIGRGRQFRVGNDWMVVGQRPMKVADICFEEGW